MEEYKILTINPGSTSTKIAVYRNAKSIFLKNIKHTSENLKDFDKITDQFHFRKDVILKELKEADIDINQISAIVGRGGLVRPIESGVYEVNDSMISDLKESPLGEHASNLGGLIASDIAESLPNARAFIADPVVVDEMEDVARITGHPEFKRHSIFHALNQKAVAYKAASDMKKPYKALNLILAHLGGGISVGIHKKGRVVDVNNALDGDGPMSPERTGSLPVGPLYKMAFSGKYTLEEMKRKNYGQGGLVAYLGTNDGAEVEKRIKQGDQQAKFIYDVMIYQIAKEIGSGATVLEGDVDAIVITGGLAYDKYLIDELKRKTSFIAPMRVYPGEDEMKALAEGAQRVLKGEENAKNYE